MVEKTVGNGLYKRTRQYGVFECDCGNELVAEMTECKQCGAHYDLTDDGEIVQIAPPIGDE